MPERICKEEFEFSDSEMVRLVQNNHKIKKNAVFPNISNITISCVNVQHFVITGSVYQAIIGWGVYD